MSHSGEESPSAVKSNQIKAILKLLGVMCLGNREKVNCISSKGEVLSITLPNGLLMFKQGNKKFGSFSSQTNVKPRCVHFNLCIQIYASQLHLRGAVWIQYQ